jgi:hypothetical protein
MPEVELVGSHRVATGVDDHIVGVAEFVNEAGATVPEDGTPCDRWLTDAHVSPWSRLGSFTAPDHEVTPGVTSGNEIVALAFARVPAGTIRPAPVALRRL